MSQSSAVMTSFQTAIGTPRPIGAIIGRLKTWILAAWARREARHAYARLLEAEGHILKDIGVTVDEVRRVLRDT